MNQKEQAHYNVCQEYLRALLGALKEKTGYDFEHLTNAWSPPNACGKLELFILENNILDFGPIWQKYKKRYASTQKAMLEVRKEA